MSHAATSKRRYTYADYLTWNDDKRWEIIGGTAYLMSSPTSRHQMISMALTRQMANHFAGQPCRLLAAPMDVVLSEEDVVQPDLLVVCNTSQIGRTHIKGPPDLVVEIVSADSPLRDRMWKLDLYARSGVKEYWIVTPWPSLVEVLLLQGRKYLVDRVCGNNDTLISPSFPNLQVGLKDVFDFPLEHGEEPPAIHEPPAPRYKATAV